MSLSRVIVTLSQEERDALVALARSQCRAPYDQARYLLRLALASHGLLDNRPKQSEPPAVSEDEALRLNGCRGGCCDG